MLEALEESADVRDVFEDIVWRHRGKKITPKTVNQKHYVDAIRECTITFGIGPAGHGQDLSRDGPGRRRAWLTGRSVESS